MKLTFSDMSVSEGRTVYPPIPAKTQFEAVSEVFAYRTFRAMTLEESLRRRGCGDEAYRGADRLLQKLRRAGAIVHLGKGIWTRAEVARADEGEAGR